MLRHFKDSFTDPIMENITQDIQIVNQCEESKKIMPSRNKKGVLFIDDLNIPKK